MTKEQAIERLKKLDHLLDDVYSTGLVEDEERNIYQDAIETVLPMLEEKDKIIEQYQNISNFQYKVYSAAVDDIFELNEKLEEKDKIINLMLETINNHDIDEDICKQMGQKEDCNEFEDKEKCKECIKQYFENKAKEAE